MTTDITTDRILSVSDAVSTFTWTAEEIDRVLTVKFEGELDLAVAAECSAALQEPLEAAERLIVFDLGGLTFLDSTGLRLLIDTKRQAEARGKAVLLSRVSDAVLRMLEVTGLLTWFTYAEGALETATCPLCDGAVLEPAHQCRQCGANLL